MLVSGPTDRSVSSPGRARIVRRRYSIAVAGSNDSRCGHFGSAADCPARGCVVPRSRLGSGPQWIGTSSRPAARQTRSASRARFSWSPEAQVTPTNSQRGCFSR